MLPVSDDGSGFKADPVDPLVSSYPFYSPYQFAANQVIHSVELEGLENACGLNVPERGTDSDMILGGLNGLNKFVNDGLDYIKLNIETKGMGMR